MRFEIESVDLMKDGTFAIRGTEYKETIKDIRKKYYLLVAIMLICTDYNHREHMNRYEAEFYYRFRFGYTNFILVWDSKNNEYNPIPKKIAGELKICRNWDDLRGLKTDKYKLDISYNYNGWVRDIRTGEGKTYLSTHTFYEDRIEDYTRLLQCYGFPVILGEYEDSRRDI